MKLTEFLDVFCFIVANHFIYKSSLSSLPSPHGNLRFIKEKGVKPAKSYQVTQGTQELTLQPWSFNGDYSTPEIDRIIFEPLTNLFHNYNIHSQTPLGILEHFRLYKCPGGPPGPLRIPKWIKKLTLGG